MTSETSERAPDAGAAVTAAEGLVRLGDRIGLVCLALLPLAMWLANRSAPLMLGLATMGFVGAALAQSGPRPVLARLRPMLASPIGLALGLFLLWALISLSWSHRPPVAGLAAWGELAVPLACGALLVASGRFRPEPRWIRLAAVALVAACVLMAVELLSGLSQRAALGIGRPYGFVFNRPVLTCLLVAAALLPLLRDGPKRDNGVWRAGLGLLLSAMVLGVILVSDSGAAAFGMLVLALVWLGALLAPRLALGIVAVGFLGAMALAPVTGLVVDRLLPADMHQRLAQSHSRERADIWLSFGEAIRARPLAGSGFASSASLDQNPVAQEVAPEHRKMLAVGHPHSAPMQAWADTGAIGAGLLALAGIQLLWRLRRLDGRRLAPRLALFAAAFAIAAVAHGAWQGWWIATLVVAAVWLLARPPSGDMTSAPSR
jgi:O-antigen ligase